MTVKELKEKLAEVPDNYNVLICQHEEEYSLSMAETAEERMCKFSDGRRARATEYAFYISDVHE